MATRIRLFSRDGTFVYEYASLCFREWVLNDIGSANFTILARGVESYIQYGNYITIEHDKLPTWVGIIAPPRQWSSKVATVSAKSVMSLFGQRVGSTTASVFGTWGDVFKQILGIVNNEENTLLRAGTFVDGINYTSTVDMSNVYTYLQRALAQAQTRLDFRPVITNGRLEIFADLYETLYTNVPLILEEGVNVKNNSPIMIEQGEIFNDVTVLGIGLEQEKFTARQVDVDSVTKYGRRQILISEGQSQSDVDRMAVVRLEQYKRPRITLGLIAMDKRDTFTYARVGNSMRAKLRTVGYNNGQLGFDATVYIRGLQYDDRSNEAVLVCEEI